MEERGFSDSELKEYLDSMEQGTVLRPGERLCDIMMRVSEDTRRLCFELNSEYRSEEDARKMFSEIVGYGLDPGFRVFTPFYSDFGKNIHIGKNVFINSCCHFQDQGGISIGDGCLIGHSVTLATIDHGMDPEHRGDCICSPIRLGKNVWIGSDVTVVGGVTIGDGAVVGAGAVVTKDVAPNTVVAGVPARFVKNVKRGLRAHIYKSRAYRIPS